MANGSEHTVGTKTRQGWCPDPFGRFEQRYWSQGTPTALVRNGRHESRDLPTLHATTPAPSRDHSPAPAPREPVATVEPWLYLVRERTRLRRALLAVAALAPPVGWFILIPNAHARTLALENYALLTTAVVALTTMFRTPRRLRRRPRPQI